MSRPAARMTTTAAAIVVAEEFRRVQRLEGQLSRERETLIARTLAGIAQDARDLGFFEGLSLGLSLGVERGIRDALTEDT